MMRAGGRLPSCQALRCGRTVPDGDKDDEPLALSLDHPTRWSYWQSAKVIPVPPLTGIKNGPLEQINSPTWVNTCATTLTFLFF